MAFSPRTPAKMKGAKAVPSGAAGKAANSPLALLRLVLEVLAIFLVVRTLFGSMIAVRRPVASCSNRKGPAA